MLGVWDDPFPAGGTGRLLRATGRHGGVCSSRDQERLLAGASNAEGLGRCAVERMPFVDLARSGRGTALAKLSPGRRGYETLRLPPSAEIVDAFGTVGNCWGGSTRLAQAGFAPALAHVDRYRVTAA